MTTRPALCSLAAAALLAAGCAAKSAEPAGPGPTPPAAAATGIALPSEISALPPRAAPVAGLRALAVASAASDYDAAQTVKFVNEQALSQFDIFNTIFKALAQTHYAEAGNVDTGPYGAMVTWIEDHGDSQQKQIVPWVVDSRLVARGGAEVNVVQVWMKMQMGDGQLHVIRVQFDISEAPVRRADGSYADYGVWTLNAKFDAAGSGFFVASASRDPGGASVVRLHQVEQNGNEVRGILQKSDAHGLGKVEFPDWSSCSSPACVPTATTVAYAYDAAAVALRKGGAPVAFKSRTDFVDLVNRYGLYDAATGADVARTRSFGFPVRFTLAGAEHFGYYGAWQGRQQLWADGQAVPAGTVVTRQDQGSGQAAEVFTVGEPIVGTLVKRTLVPAALSDLVGLVSETWVGEGFGLERDQANTRWQRCTYAPFVAGQPYPPPSCADFTDFSVLDPAPRRMVNVSLSTGGPSPTPLVYQGGKLWLASGDPPSAGGTEYQPAGGDRLWVNVNGPRYLSYTGAGWVRKKLVSFDQQTYTPAFDPQGDLPFALEQGREYSLNSSGSSFVVQFDGASTSVKIELQSVANPQNAAAFVPAGTVLEPQWGGAGASTYEFVTDPASPGFLKLVYRTVGANDPSGAVGAVVTSGLWGLLARDANGASMGLQFNWDYPQAGQTFGTQQYLLDAQGHARMLDDPIRFLPVTLPDHSGAARTLQLQFDGSWVGGLPDVFRDLRLNGGVLSPEIVGRIVVIPSGTEVVDAADPGKRYRFKQLQVSEFLATIDDPGNLSTAAAEALDLSSVPDLLDPGMGDWPELPTRYSEGKPVP